MVCNVARCSHHDETLGVLFVFCVYLFPYWFYVAILALTITELRGWGGGVKAAIKTIKLNVTGIP
jgi:uncharacterized paraquat-inducible protein A